jgi:hypothetical protein
MVTPTPMATKSQIQKNSDDLLKDLPSLVPLIELHRKAKHSSSSPAELICLEDEEEENGKGESTLLISGTN